MACALIAKTIVTEVGITANTLGTYSTLITYVVSMQCKRYYAVTLK